MMLRPSLQFVSRATALRPRAAALLGQTPALVPVLASPLVGTRGYHGLSHMGSEPWMGQQAHATTILSVRKDDKVVRARRMCKRSSVPALVETNRTHAACSGVRRSFSSAMDRSRSATR